MLRRLTVVMLLLGLAAPVAAQDAQSILAEMDRRQTERLKGVQDYLLVRNVAGIRVATWHEKDANGVFRAVPIDEIMDRSAAEANTTRPQMTHELAAAYEMMGNVMRQEMKREGFPADGPFDPRNMFDPMATFIRAGANREPMSDGRAEAQSAAAGLAEFARRARFVGREEVEGIDAFHLQATDLKDIQVEQSGGVQFELSSASLYIDPAEYVPIKMVIEGRAREGRDWMPVTIEKLDLNYRRVGSMYEPHEQIMRLGGIEEAMAEQMKELEAQLAQLPPAMRGMLQNQMKNAMNQFEAVVYIEEILINTGVPTDEELARLIRPTG